MGSYEIKGELKRRRYFSFLHLNQSPNSGGGHGKALRHAQRECDNNHHTAIFPSSVDHDSSHGCPHSNLFFKK